VKEIFNWYSTQSFSSRILLALMVFMIVVFFLFQFVIDPWKQGLTNLKSQVHSKASTVRWMENEFRKNQNLILTASKKSNKSNSNQSKASLIARIEQSAKKQNIYASIERITPDKAGRVKVWIKDGDFRKWINWVHSLKKQSINVYNARVNQSDKKEPVTINVTFELS